MWAPRKQLGFTIVELLIVIVVIAILAAITIVAYTGIQDRAKASAMVSEVNQVVKKLEAYKVQNNDVYPTNLGSADIVESAGYSYNYTPAPNYTGYSFDLQDGAKNYFATSGSTTPTKGSGNGLVAWWPYDGSVTEVVAGLQSTLYGATPTNGQNGDTNGAYSFNGNNNRIDSPGIPPIVLNNAVRDYTFSFWYNASHTGDSDVRFILSRRTSDGSSSTDYIFFIYSGYLTFGTGSGNDCSWPDSSASTNRVPEPSRNAWHHVVGTISPTSSTAGQKTVWVDGQKITDCTYSGKSTAGSADLHVGTRHSTGSGANYFQGSLDDLRMYNRILTDQEIESLFSIGAQ